MWTTVPYQVGVSLAVVGALSSIPLVFHRETALWYNETFECMAEVPEELDTLAEVSIWTWNWMEPQVRCVEGLLMGGGWGSLQCAWGTMCMCR